ncbi:Hypothetical predicted protein [Olea europaea subsp. europaea]|uniref:Uncharacterized protein n=1 Tax=Olea europaea subsp. europaea TaxID=158383 RepID=A0A8S0V7T3_OLEEU|nr:Hypothetical predicted protein [Olea europaea subsp. europaea]
MRMTGVWKGSHIMPQTTWLLRKPATVPTNSTVSMRCSRLKGNVENTTNIEEVQDHNVSSSQTHQIFGTQESVDYIRCL